MSPAVLPANRHPDDPQARARAAHNRVLAPELRGELAEAALGGSEKIWERHNSRAKSLNIGAGTNEIRHKLIGAA